MIKPWMFIPRAAGVPFLEGWSYRKAVSLSRASGAVSNYQMKLLLGESSGATGEDVDCGGLCQIGFDDIRFTTSDGVTLLDYWIESITGATPNQLATIWIEFDSIGTGATTFYMYYGNAAAPAVSNGENTFLFFDDFPGSSIDTAKWDVTGSGITVGSSVAVLAATTGDKLQRLFSDSAWLIDGARRMRARVKSLYVGSTAGECTIAGFNSAYNRFMTADVSHRTAANSNKYNNNNGGVTSAAAISGVSADTYAILQVKRAASANWTVNDANAVNHATNYPTDDLRIFLRADYNTGNQTLSVDWVFVSYCLPTEPAWGAWGAQE